MKVFPGVGVCVSGSERESERVMFEKLKGDEGERDRDYKSFFVRECVEKVSASE